MKLKKFSRKFYFIALSILTVLIFISVIFFYNSENIYKKAFKAFFYFPDKFKSLFMIVTDKRSFANLYNDYNVKFLPNTHYVDLDFYRKKTNITEGNSVLWDRFNKTWQDRYTFYLEVFKNEILIITQNGSFYKTKIDNLINKNQKIKYSSLNSNLQLNKIKDSLIINNKLYISHVNITPKGCPSLEILYADINTNLNFKILKKFTECGSLGVDGGRMQNYNFNGKDGILITTASTNQDRPDKQSQDDNSIYGKILFLDLQSEEYEIFSKGHRNAQGLAVKGNTILSTEHGPRGGDEINKIIYNSNYGWPIASYGEPYEKDYKIEYSKSHLKHGFVEPLYAFVPSIGISELLITPENFEDKWKNSILVTSLNGRSIYIVKFQTKKLNKIVYIEKIFIGERIRDIKYVDKLKLFILSLERTGNIGIIKRMN